jgi:hypothetical protein
MQTNRIGVGFLLLYITGGELELLVSTMLFVSLLTNL